MATKKKSTNPQNDSKRGGEDTEEKKKDKKYLEKEISDAQYMMIYATTYCEKDIDQKTIETLIKARLLVESGQILNATQEANFRIAYQKLWEIVKPATAETIKANMDIEHTFWGNKISRSRRKVNQYITFTSFVLLLLLFFQIYWVIGDQLTVRLNSLLAQRSELNLKLDSNQKDYDLLETRYMQEESTTEDNNGNYAFYSSPAWKRDSLDNSSEKKQLKADLDTLDSQISRSLSILTKWSYPWTWALALGDKEGAHLSQYQSQFDNIEHQINDLKEKSSDEQIEQTVNDHNDPIQQQINNIVEQINNIGDVKVNPYLNEFSPTIATRISELDNFLSTRSKLLDLGSKWQATPGFSKEEDEVQKEIDGVKDVEILMKDAGGREKTISLKCIYAFVESLFSEVTPPPSGQELIENSPYCDPGSGEVGDNYDASQISIWYGNLVPEVLEDVFSKLEDEKQFLEQAMLKQSLEDEKENLKSKIIKAETVKVDLDNQMMDLLTKKEELIKTENDEKNKNLSFEAQVAGQLFVLNILQSYILPILYGLLGAGTSVLRSLSRNIKDVTFSGVVEIQHILSISLGALTGIMVGWFSFLLPQESVGFLGSVSPLAIAFLVGYNIELFFTKMDLALTKAKEDTSTDQSGRSKPK